MASTRGTLESRLGNGLEVILREDHSAPIASIWTWYRVGSRNEVPGKTGLSHWVEHMQFKGTPSFEKGEIFKSISRVGGTLNAMTSHDWTAYFETVPRDQIDLGLRIESDRMANSIFDAKEVDAERTVILSERQGAENRPGYALYEEVTGGAFRAHPYRHMVIGYAEDLRRITRDDLYAHYRRFYHPANAFIVAVGDFRAEEMLTQIEQAFGELAPGEAVPLDIGVTEPEQAGERRVLLRRPSGAPYLRMAYHAPAAAGEDVVPLLVAEAVLSGGKPMGFGGGGGMGRSSRLYTSLVASGLARGADSDMSITIDPYLFQVGVTALPGGDLAKVELVVERELARLREEKVPDDELERAMRQLEAQFVYSSEGVTNQAYWLGQWNIVDDWRRADTLPEQIRAVTSDDVLRVAQRYLLPERRTVGWLVPTDSEANGHAAAEQASAFTVLSAWGLTGPVAAGGSDRGALRRTVLPNGVIVLGQERPDSRSVTLIARVRAGSVYERPEESGLAFLTGRALLRGADGRSFEEINRRTDELGSSISVDAGRQFVDVRVRCLNQDLPEMIGLVAAALLRPDFPEHEVDLVRAEQLGAISEADNDTRASADRLLRRAVYPEPNPLGRRILGTNDTVVGFGPRHVKAFYASAFGPMGTTVALVGGMSGFEKAVETIAAATGAWEPHAGPRAATNLAITNEEPLRTSDVIAGKSQADIAAGIATIARGNEDYYALDVANLILGRLGLMGRLGAEVRDRQGLAYYAFSQIEPRRDGSLWVMRAGVDPGNVDRALGAISAELDRLRTTTVSVSELEDAKSHLIGVLPLSLETHDGVAAMLLAIEEFGLGLDYLDRYPEIIGQITAEDVREVASRHLEPKRLAIGVAGPPA